MTVEKEKKRKRKQLVTMESQQRREEPTGEESTAPTAREKTIAHMENNNKKNKKKKSKKSKKTREGDEEGDSSVQFPDLSRPLDETPKRKSTMVSDKQEKVPVEIIVENHGQGLEHFSVSQKKRKKGITEECNGNKRSKSKHRKITEEEEEGIGNEKPGTTEKHSKIMDRQHLSKEKRKRVSFACQVEVFPTNETSDHSKLPNGISTLPGKRMTREEDEVLKDFFDKFIKERGLGDDGISKILHCKQYPEAGGWLKEASSLLPWREPQTIYKRVHSMFASKRGKWSPEELEIVKRHHETNGAEWKDVASLLGRFADHVKDAWRRYRLPNKKKGRWSQDEYQRLFELVNLDLRMKVGCTETIKDGNRTRDNIPWYAISNKHSTRTHQDCCVKWYYQLSSAMVVQGLWADSDDYLLIDVLSKLDACCEEDVDWDHLIESRSGDLCRKRWTEMTRHIGGYREKSFMEQVDILSTRYCPELYEYKNGTLENQDNDEES